MNYSYCNTGHISSKDDIEILERMLLHNYPVISKFNHIVVHQNSSVECEKYLADYNGIWKKIFGKDVILIPSLKNRGHTFGSMDSDNVVIDCAKNLSTEFIFKSASDILLTENVFSIIPSDEFDFYFLQGIGYTGLTPFNYDIDSYVDSYWHPQHLYPQSNFYIIRNTVDYIYNKDEIDQAVDMCESIPNYNGRTWEYISNFSCEYLLKRCAIRNKFKCKHLLTDAKFRVLLNLIISNKMCDCSHKNVLFEDIGVCHFHYKNGDTCLII